MTDELSGDEVLKALGIPDPGALNEEQYRAALALVRKIAECGVALRKGAGLGWFTDLKGGSRPADRPMDEATLGMALRSNLNVALHTIIMLQCTQGVKR